MHKKYGLLLICFTMPLFAGKTSIEEFDIIERYGLETTHKPSRSNVDSKWQIEALRMKMSELRKENAALRAALKTAHTKQTAAIIIGSAGSSTPLSRLLSPADVSSNGSSPISELAVSPLEDGFLLQMLNINENMEIIDINDSASVEVNNEQANFPSYNGNALQKTFREPIAVDEKLINTVLLQPADSYNGNKLQKPFRDELSNENKQTNFSGSEKKSILPSLSAVKDHTFGIRENAPGSGISIIRYLLPHVMMSHLPL